MTLLRRRMIEDMELAGLTKGTQKKYLVAVRQLAKAFMISPDRITEKQVREYILALRDGRGVARGTFKTHSYGLKFFYTNTLGVDWPLFVKKKCANRIRSGCQWPPATRIAVVCSGRSKSRGTVSVSR